MTRTCVARGSIPAAIGSTLLRSSEHHGQTRKSFDRTVRIGHCQRFGAFALLSSHWMLRYDSTFDYRRDGTGMQAGYLIAILGFIASFAVRASCLDSLPAHRAEMESELSKPDSSFDEAFKKRFSGLSYFDGDQAYCVEASFEPILDATELKIPTFNGETLPFRKYGVFRFHLDGAIADRVSAYGSSGERASMGVDSIS